MRGEEAPTITAPRLAANYNAGVEGVSRQVLSKRAGRMQLGGRTVVLRRRVALSPGALRCTGARFPSSRDCHNKHVPFPWSSDTLFATAWAFHFHIHKHGTRGRSNGCIM
jgi:hypothetical protein